MSTTSTTELATPWALCPEYASGVVMQPDGSVLFANEVVGVGCLVVRSSGFDLSIWEVDVAPGWTYTTKVSDGSKLSVEFTQPLTGERHSIRVEPGKTVIR